MACCCNERERLRRAYEAGWINGCKTCACWPGSKCCRLNYENDFADNGNNEDYENGCGCNGNAPLEENGCGCNGSYANNGCGRNGCGERCGECYNETENRGCGCY